MKNSLILWSTIIWSKTKIWSYQIVQHSLVAIDLEGETPNFEDFFYHGYY